MLQNLPNRVKIVEGHDPDRPSWATTETILLSDHPNTYAGYLTKHFYSDTINLGDEIPAWTYDTISSYGLDTADWSSDSNAMPSNSDPVPNTQGVYSGQAYIFQNTLKDYKVSDIDVLRFWPAGRPNAYGGLPPYQLYNSTTESLDIVGGASVIDKGQLDNSNLSPFTYFYVDGWLNDCKYLPLTLPSYMHKGHSSADFEIYPRVPKLGGWQGGMRDLGIKSWSWETKSTSKKYGRFCNAWHQNLAATDFRNTTFLTNQEPLSTEEYPSQEYTYQKQCGADGDPGTAPSTNEQGLSIVSYSGDATDAGEANLFLLDTLWDTTYYIGGFNIENRGLAYHLRNAVDWENLGDAPSIGGLTDDTFYDAGSNIIDGNVGPIPPVMNFAGAGGTWDLNLKNISPYNKYLDLKEEQEKLEAYYSNTGSHLICEILDGPKKGQIINVKKPHGLLVTNQKSQRVCPEYTEGEILYTTLLNGEFLDLNVAARQLIDYSQKGTLEPYFDYFPDTYIPFETNFLLPQTQKIPNYSFNCSKYTYTDEIKVQGIGSLGAKGEKGSTIGSTSAGQKGEKGQKGQKGAKGSVGADGGAGAAGQKGQKGEVGDSPAGPKGIGIITGSFGTVNAEKSNYTLSANGTISQVLGTAANPASNSATTISFTRKYFGVATENVGGANGCSYSGMYIWASDYVD